MEGVLFDFSCCELVKIVVIARILFIKRFFVIRYLAIVVESDGLNTYKLLVNCSH